MIIFDIETEAHPDVRKYVKAKAPANYKDPAKIAEFVAIKTREEIEHAALDPDLCTVRAIGILPIEPTDPLLTFVPDPVVMVVGDGWTESEMIRNFWELLWAHRGECVGYNILGFDFPVLLHRSMEIGIQALSHHSQALDFRRYQTFPIRDLYGILYNWQPGRGLKWVCERFGIARTTAGMDGSMVKDMDNAKLREYLTDDLHSIATLHEMMQGVYF